MVIRTGMKETVAILSVQKPKKQVRFTEMPTIVSQCAIKKHKTYETEYHPEKKEETVMDVLLYKILERVLAM